MSFLAQLALPPGAQTFLSAAGRSAAALSAEPWFKRCARVARVLLPAAIVAYLIYKLSQMGFARIWQSVPASPLFYAVLLLSYLVQPVGDLLVYRQLWPGENPPGLGIFLKKRVINNALLSYSGEVYLFLWARRNLGIPAQLLTHSIKDSNILSGAVAVLAVLGLLGGLALTGNWHIPAIAPEDKWIFFAAACLPLVLSLGLIFARRRFTVLHHRQIFAVFAIHAMRNVLGQVLLVWLWTLAVPSVALAAWLNFLALRLLLSHAYFLPNRNLFVLTAEIGLAASMGLPEVAVAAALLTISAGYQAMHAATMGVLPVRGALRKATDEDPSAV